MTRAPAVSRRAADFRGGCLVKPHTPREWFIAPLDSIELAAQLLINGEIIHYCYDPVLLEVVER